jgi:TonB family protein
MTRKLLTLTLTALLLFASPIILTQMVAPAPAATSAPMKIGGDVLPPVLVHSANPKFVRGFHTPGTTAIVQVGLIVNTVGKPAKIHIVKSSDSSFDKNSMDAVAKYRFKPATLHGQPVPVELVVEVKFEIFD